MFRIGEFSKLTQVSVRMLRYYDDIGLFKPIKIHEFTRYRYYSAKQISKLNKIVSFRDMGFTTSEIAEVLNSNSDNKIFGILKRKQKEIQQIVKQENLKLKKIDIVINSLGKENLKMNYEVKLKKIPSYKVVSLRDTIQDYSKEGQLWGRLMKFIKKYKISFNDVNFTIYHDGEYKEKDVDIEVIMGVDNMYEDKEGITFKKMQSVPCVATVMVPGDFSNLSSAYNSLANWIEERDYEICGLARQILYRGPWCEENPENYLAEIQMPVKKK